MCLIAVAYDAHPEYRLIVLANRDEFYTRSALGLRRWADGSGIIAGRDERGCGTWMGVTSTGRFSAVTNYREVGRVDSAAPTRGQIPVDFLKNADDPETFVGRLQAQAQRYNGFNVLVGNRDKLCYYSNRGDDTRLLSPGVYGLSNHLLDTPWPKVQRAKEALTAEMRSENIDPDRLLVALRDARRADEASLPDTGVGIALEKKLSSVFINFDGYGTRSSTILLVARGGGGCIIEQSYEDDGRPAQRVEERFDFEDDQDSRLR